VGFVLNGEIKVLFRKTVRVLCMSRGTRKGKWESRGGRKKANDTNQVVASKVLKSVYCQGDGIQRGHRAGCSGWKDGVDKNKARKGFAGRRDVDTDIRGREMHYAHSPTKT